MYTLSIQRWVGGRSSKLHAESLLTKMATARLYTLTLPPTGTCQIVQFTPLRSVYHKATAQKQKSVLGSVSGGPEKSTEDAPNLTPLNRPHQPHPIHPILHPPTPYSGFKLVSVVEKKRVSDSLYCYSCG